MIVMPPHARARRRPGKKRKKSLKEALKNDSKERIN
jgi:hypothetical protein